MVIDALKYFWFWFWLKERVRESADVNWAAISPSLLYLSPTLPFEVFISISGVVSIRWVCYQQVYHVNFPLWQSGVYFLLPCWSYG